MDLHRVRHDQNSVVSVVGHSNLAKVEACVDGPANDRPHPIGVVKTDEMFAGMPKPAESSLAFLGEREALKLRSFPKVGLDDLAGSHLRALGARTEREAIDTR